MLLKTNIIGEIKSSENTINYHNLSFMLQFSHTEFAIYL